MGEKSYLDTSFKNPNAKKGKSWKRQARMSHGVVIRELPSPNGEGEFVSQNGKKRKEELPNKSSKKLKNNFSYYLEMVEERSKK